MWSEPQWPGSSWFLFYRLSANLNASINPRRQWYAKWFFVGSNLLISARLQLICGLSSGELLPLCHWNFSLHFTPVRFITFLRASSSVSSANTHVNIHIQKKTLRSDAEGGHVQQCCSLHLLQKWVYIDTCLCTAQKTFLESHARPSRPSPTRSRSFMLTYMHLP